MQFYYGIEGKYTDITSLVKVNSSINEYMFIPATENSRSQIYGDPLYGITKNIKIITSDNNIIYVNPNKSCIVNSLTNEVQVGNPRYFWNKIGKFIEPKDMRLDILHKFIHFEHGNIKDEYPEQFMVMLNLDGGFSS